MKISPTWKFTLLLCALVVAMLWVPGLFPRAVERVFRLGIILALPVLFVYLGVLGLRQRSGLWMSLTVFTAGLAVELLSFAYLYRFNGLFRIMPRPGDGITESLVFVRQHDLLSCFLLSVHLWTSGGDGSLVANPSDTWLTSIEMVMGYLYMAIFVAIVVSALQQEYVDPPERPHLG